MIAPLFLVFFLFETYLMGSQILLRISRLIVQWLDLGLGRSDWSYYVEIAAIAWDMRVSPGGSY